MLEGQEEYFLVDLIQSQDERNSFYVGVHKNAIVGMLALSLDVNVPLIMKLFEVEAFPDIIIAKEKRPPPPPLLIGLVGDLRILSPKSYVELASALGCLFINAEELQLPSLAVDEEKDGGKTEMEAGEEDARAAASAVSMLLAHIDGKIRASPTPLLGCTVVGFPRTDAEAMMMSQGKFAYDRVLELTSDGEN